MATGRKTHADVQRLRNTSDELLADVHELKRLEAIKRQHEISSPEFRYLADQITEKSREIFRVADEERHVGETLDPPAPTTTDEIES